jgi:galactokinase
MTLLDKVKVGFVSHFKMPTGNIFRAPGRVNLIGEYTDYNDGFVPQGSGLSSSAALEVVLGLAYSSLSQEKLSSKDKAFNRQHDFEVTVPEIDCLVELVNNTIGDKGGVRMTGGGFGACVVALVPNDMTEQVKTLIADNDQNKTGLVADVFVCAASQGAEDISA